MQQLDLFEDEPLPKDEQQAKTYLMNRIRDLKDAHNALRKGIFQRHNELKKVVLDLQMKIEQPPKDKPKIQVASW